METVTQCRSQAWRSSLSFAVEQRLVNVWLLLQLPYQCPLLVSAMKLSSIAQSFIPLFFFQYHISIVVCWLFFCCWQPLTMIQYESLPKQTSWETARERAACVALRKRGCPGLDNCRNRSKVCICVLICADVGLSYRLSFAKQDIKAQNLH